MREFSTIAHPFQTCPSVDGIVGGQLSKGKGFSKPIPVLPKKVFSGKKKQRFGVSLFPHPHPQIAAGGFGQLKLCFYCPHTWGGERGGRGRVRAVCLEALRRERTKLRKEWPFFLKKKILSDKQEPSVAELPSGIWLQGLDSSKAKKTVAHIRVFITHFVSGLKRRPWMLQQSQGGGRWCKSPVCHRMLLLEAGSNWVLFEFQNAQILLLWVPWMSDV